MAESEDYLEATTSDAPAIAAAEVMDRLGERLKSTDSSAESLTEMTAAGQAIATLAEQADSPVAVIDTARNEAGEVASKARRKKESIIERIEAETDEVLQQEADEVVRLEHLYGLDRYLEEDLSEVLILRSSDEVTDPTFRWKFSDGARIEHDDSVHMDRYNFWKKLVQGSQKRLTHEMASEQVGDPEDDEERYRKLSLGPPSRPWHPSTWVECIQDLLEERRRVKETDGPRSGTWEEIQNWIRQTRAVADEGDAIREGQLHAKLTENPGELEEIWVPAKVINTICEEWSVTATALQAELSERGIDSDEVAGDGISEAMLRDGTATRFWRLDATHGDVPDPDEIVEELNDDITRDTGDDPGHGFEYGGDDT